MKFDAARMHGVFYLLITLGLLIIGLHILVHRKGGLHVWRRPFGYRIAYFYGKPAFVAGVAISSFSAVFLLDAVRSLLVEEADPVLYYLFCCGTPLLAAAINIYAWQYLEPPGETKE